MRFRGEYYFLSNMYPCEFEYNGEIYPCAETAFQVRKCKYETDKEKFKRNGKWVDGFEAKRIGRTVRLIDCWDYIKEDYMRDILFAKFTSNKSIENKLLATDRMNIQEENDWHDTYWGVCNGVGKNRLGCLLMQVRSLIKERGEIYEKY